MMYQQNMNGITGNQSLFMKAAEQLSSGKRVINPSDDPLAASRGDVVAVAGGKQPIHAGAYFRSPKRLDGRNGIAGATSTIADMKALIVNAGGTKAITTASRWRNCRG